MVSKVKPAEVPAVPLDEILRPLSDALRQASGRMDLAMNEIERVSENRALYALTGNGSVAAQTDRKCILNQIFPKTDPELWLGVLLELRKRAREVPGGKDKYEIFHVSIQAFEGTTSQTVEPLLRAEWDQSAARKRHGPAQPHWHAYAMSTERREEFQDEDYGHFEGVIKPDNPKQRQHKMHFALCANWQKEGGSHFEVLNTTDELNRWIVGALEYIRKQVHD
jgi:hypothetical protein